MIHTVEELVNTAWAIDLGILGRFVVASALVPMRSRNEDDAAGLCSVAAIEEVALSKIYENTCEYR
jgi:hypothetical protein